MAQVSNMTAVDVNDFSQERRCTYEDECYSVRDNGAVFRFQPDGKRARPNDNQWTFGIENSANPYLHIAGVRVHRLVATAFHGEPPDSTFVVDHIDSNCRNNRPGNLRWLTRLENALKNPATRKKIEYLCGSIEAFLKNPSMLNDLRGDPNFKWMRTVTEEEGKNCMLRMSLWANSDSKPAQSIGVVRRKSSLSERVFKPIHKWELGFDRELGFEMASTPRCACYMWTAGDNFPCCPQEFGTDPLDDYLRNLKSGAVLAYSDPDSKLRVHENFCPELTVINSSALSNKPSILVMCERPDNKWSIIGITLLEEKNHFIHFILGTYLNREEADKAFSAKQEFTDFWSEAYAHFQDLFRPKLEKTPTTINR
jgi:HNH endonuclease